MEQERCKLILGDCLEKLKDISDNSVDCIIADPPYSGLTSKSKGRGRFSQEDNHISYDDLTERGFLLFIKPILKELYRVSKIGGHFYCFTDWKQLRNMMDTIELSSFKVLTLVCWNKGHFGTGSGYRSQAEYILVFSKGLPKTFNLKNVGNVITIKREKGLHPHQKPLDLLEILIKNSCNKSDVVLDPFMGAGTSGLACVKNEINFIGIDIEKKYFDITENRIKEFENQSKLVAFEQEKM